MSLLEHLQFQKIDNQPDDTLAGYDKSDTIKLNESTDEASLENYWDSVVQDIHDDPEWFSFFEK